MTQTIFLLSPAHAGGRRARMLMRDETESPLAMRIRREGAPLGDVYTFVSGLYFRGKLAYAQRFAASWAPQAGVLVIVPGRGLVPPATLVTRTDLEAIAAIPVSLDEPRYREPLERDVRALAAGLADGDLVVLLGSVATGKYVGVLEGLLPGRLCFPSEFVGRGDMSRGGLMLRCVEDGVPLTYVPVTGALRHGPRPPRLVPR